MARALFIGARSSLSAGALAGWLDSGNQVAAFWSGEPGVKADPFGAPRLSPGGLLSRHGIPNVTVPRLSKWPGLMDAVDASGADLLITCATRMIVPDRMLEHFGRRAVNVHPAMLPEYRGPWPYLPMLLDGRGDADGGVTLHVLSSGIDEGEIVAQERVPYSAFGADFTDWYAALIHASCRLVRDRLPAYLEGGIAAVPQTGGSYHGLSPPLVLDPSLAASDIRRMIERAGSTMRLAVRVPGRAREVRVGRMLRSAPRAGKPLTLSSFTVEMDVADARVTLLRITGMARQWARWRLAWALRPLQL